MIEPRGPRSPVHQAPLVAAAALAVLAVGCTRPIDRQEPTPDARPEFGEPVLEIRTPREDALLDADRILVDLDTLRLAVGERRTFRVRVVDREGVELHGVAPHTSGAEGLIELRDGEVIGIRAGSATLILELPAPAGTGREPIRARLPVRVVEPEGRGKGGTIGEEPGWGGHERTGTGSR